MSMIKRVDPFGEIERFFDDQDFFGFIPAVKRNLVPSMDIYETNDSVVIEVELGSIDPKNVRVSVEEGVLKIKGDEKQEEEQKDRNYYRREIRRGSFERTVNLGKSVDEDSVEAKYDNGILKVTIKKAPEKVARHIEIK